MASPDQILEDGLRELGVSASPDQIEQLLRLAALLSQWAGRFNLTAHREPEEIVGRLILDAAAQLRLLPPFESLADLGSGAGFPGLPLAILSGARTTLVEAREKRHHFQRSAVRELRLDHVVPRRGRIEVLEAEPHAAVIAQAVGRPQQVVTWMLPWSEPGGLLVVPGGFSGHAAPGGDTLAEIPGQTLPYSVPLGGPSRTLWLARSPR